MYEIRPESVKTFLADRKINFPRFQRRQAWDGHKNFKLCISVFKNFPIGVTVINREESNCSATKWLLDGRQRRNALMKMMENPEEIYHWARKFLKIKSNDQLDVIEEKFWKAIQEHLEKDESNESEDSLIDDLVENEQYNDLDAPEIIVMNGNDEDDQNDTYLVMSDKDADLKILLKIILMVHNTNKKGSGFTRPFDFTKFIGNLEYVDIVDGFQKLNCKKVKSFILEFYKHCYDDEIDTPDSEYFFDYIVDRYKVQAEKQFKLKCLVEQKWERIKERMDIIDKIETKLQETIIGIIELKNASIIDAQNIFKLINSEGTQLTSEEILSAKPSWNIKINNLSTEFIEEVKKLYVQLGIKSSDAVRWDFPATLIGRIKNSRFIFKDLSYKKDSEFKSRITLGFKILSAIYEYGINKNNVANLAKNTNLKWREDLETFVNEINTVTKLISEYSYFKYFRTWNISLMEITSVGISINFIAIMYKDWERKGKPIGADAKKLQKNAAILFDKLIYEYVTKQWRGSGDSRIAEDVKSISNSSEIFIPVDSSKWERLISEIIDSNTINGDDTTLDLLKPILYHYYCLSQCSGPNDPDVIINIDHIYSQSIFEKSALANKELFKNNLFNLTLLPRMENICKSDKALSFINDQWLRDQIVKYTGISESEFLKYSDINNINELREQRKQLYLIAFKDKRNRLFNN